MFDSGEIEMTEYKLQKTANQSFSISLNDHIFEITIRTFREISYCSAAIDMELVEAGAKAVPNHSIFGSSVNNIAGGIFMFKCLADDYPHYENFNGVDVRFVFVPFGEV